MMVSANVHLKQWLTNKKPQHVLHVGA